MPQTIYVQGAFVGTGSVVNIPVPNGPSKFVTTNITQQAATQSGPVAFQFTWFNNPSFPTGGAMVVYKGSSGAVTTGQITTGGFTYLTDYPSPSAALTGTTITQASSAVASVTNTYSNGDRVVIYNSTGMLQIGGMAFTISSVSGSQFTLIGLDSSGFAAGATAFNVRKIASYNPVVPEFLYVTAISQASQGVVKVSVDPTNLIYVGQKLTFRVPSSFGMIEMNEENLNGIPVIVTAVNYSAYQFTINTNTSAFTAFAFPASSGSPTTALFATCAPAGNSVTYSPYTNTYTGYNIDKSPFRSGQEFPLMMLAGGSGGPGGQSGDIVVWESWSAPVQQYQSGT